MRASEWIGLALLVGLLGGASEAKTWPSSLVDDQGRPVRLELLTGDARASVFIFVRTDCPISNRYAPEIRRIHSEFSTRGVLFRLVYVDPNQQPAAIRDHLKKYDLPLEALRDPKHELVELTGATVTPEAAVFDSSGEMVYRGRIDDRYIDFGQSRPEPTRRDLAEALTAVLEGRSVAEPRTKAVGCFIEDLR